MGVCCGCDDGYLDMIMKGCAWTRAHGFYFEASAVNVCKCYCARGHAMHQRTSCLPPTPIIIHSSPSSRHTAHHHHPQHAATPSQPAAKQEWQLLPCATAPQHASQLQQQQHRRCCCRHRWSWWVCSHQRSCTWQMTNRGCWRHHQLAVRDNCR